MKKLSLLSYVFIVLGLWQLCLSESLNAQSDPNWVQIATPEMVRDFVEVNGTYYVAAKGGFIVYDTATGDREHFF